MIKKKNPQDSTLRNVRAAKKRQDQLRNAVEALAGEVSKVEVQQGEHEARLRKLESVLFFGGGEPPAQG